MTFDNAGRKAMGGGRGEPVVADLPAGRKTLPSDWFAGDFEDGTTLLARELSRQRRARIGPCKRPWDETQQRQQRSESRWALEMERRGIPVEIDHPSRSYH